jgi:predicted RNA-binding protein with PUA domain
MDKNNCACGKEHQQESCAACRSEEIFSYWCDSCERSVPEKRCPYCGLKARRKRQNGPGQS